MYYGTITSLYGALPADVVLLLEDAILKTKVGVYQAAEELFENDLSEYHLVPIVALERSELYLSQFKCLRALNALNMVPNPLRQKNDEQQDLQLLMEMSRGALEIKTEGVISSAQKAMREIQTRWATKPVEDYTDVQVRTHVETGLQVMVQEADMLHNHRLSAYESMSWLVSSY